MRPRGEAFLDRADAVFVNRPALRRHPRLQIGLVDVRRQRIGFEKRHPHAEQAVVSRGAQVVRDDKRQPEQVVGAFRAEPSARGFVPPVQHVAFGELLRGRSENLRLQQIGPRERQRHDVLQLIAESERAAWLVVARPRPQPAARRLIEQPAIHHHVEGIVWRVHLNRAEVLVPASMHGGEAPLCGVGGAVPPDQVAGSLHVSALAQREHDFLRFAWRQRDDDVEGGTGIEAGAESRRQQLTAKGRRLRNRSVAPEKRSAIAGRRHEQLAGVGERHAPTEVAVELVAREHRSGFAVDLRHHVRLLISLRRTEPPLVVADEAQAPRLLAAIRQLQQRQLNRIIRVDEDRQLVIDTRDRSRERRRTGRMAHETASAAGGAANGSRRRRPDLAALVVSHEQRFADRIGDRIVPERRQPVLAAVLRPCVGRP